MTDREAALREFAQATRGYWKQCNELEERYRHSGIWPNNEWSRAEKEATKEYVAKLREISKKYSHLDGPPITIGEIHAVAGKPISE